MNCGYGCWLDRNSPMTLFITSCGGKKSSRNCGRIRATTRASKGNPFLILKIIKNLIYYDWTSTHILFFSNLIGNGKNILLSSLSRQVLSTDAFKSSCNLNNRLPKEVYQSCQKPLQVCSYPTLSPFPFWIITFFEGLELHQRWHLPTRMLKKLNRNKKGQGDHSS